MILPIVRVVGLGPGDQDLVTARTLALIERSPVVRLRTRVHPAAGGLERVPSYDEWYERASSFEELYASIAEDLARLAISSPNGEVVYAVPGSPVVAERTVELVSTREDVRTICEPAVSVIDVVCAAMGSDPMTAQLRVLDALSSIDSFRGPGPLLVLQTYSPEVMAGVASRLPPATKVTVLHHVGLADQEIVELNANELPSFTRADHLTSLWIDGLRTAGETIDDLVDFTRLLRRECPWDQEQTHASLTRHLLEESYEALDALETFARLEAAGTLNDEAIAHVEEELGDLLFQVVFHAELGDEEDRFNLATIADGVRDKLIGRHPHVFGDVHASDANDVATRWEVLKRVEKGRTSVTDGIAWQLPALTLYAKLLRKADQVGVASPETGQARERVEAALATLNFEGAPMSDTETSADVRREWGDVLVELVRAAQRAGVDLEGVMRARANDLRDEIRAREDDASV